MCHISGEKFVMAVGKFKPDVSPITGHQIVINDEGQYSIWSVDKDIPRGWKNAGFQGTQEECLIQIDDLWTDMLPKSLRS